MLLAALLVNFISLPGRTGDSSRAPKGFDEVEWLRVRADSLLVGLDIMAPVSRVTGLRERSPRDCWSESVAITGLATTRFFGTVA